MAVLCSSLLSPYDVPTARSDGLSRCSSWDSRKAGYRSPFDQFHYDLCRDDGLSGSRGRAGCAHVRVLSHATKCAFCCVLLLAAPGSVRLRMAGGRGRIERNVAFLRMH